MVLGALCKNVTSYGVRVDRSACVQETGLVRSDVNIALYLKLVDS